MELPYLFDAFIGSPVLDRTRRTTDLGDVVAQFTSTGDPGWSKSSELRYFV